MQNISKSFADMIKDIMRQRNMSQQDLRKLMSEVAGYEVKQPFVNRVLSGNVNITMQSVNLICTALGYDISFTLKSKQ